MKLPHREHIANAINYVSNRRGRRKAVAAQYTLRALSRVTPTIEVEGGGGIRYFVDTRDEGVGLQVFRYGGFDIAATQEIVELLKQETGRTLRDRVFVDIGANIGTTTAVALMTYGARSVIAVEPAPRNLELMHLMLKVNGLEERTRTYQLALSDREGTATVAIALRHGGDDRVVTPSNRPLLKERPTVDVPMTLLDNLQIDFGDVSVVWVDVQGHEGHVLAGALHLLQSDVPVVIEYAPRLLREAGGWPILHELVAAHFKACIDCHTGLTVSARSLSRLAEQYVGDAYTDVLLVHH